MVSFLVAKTDKGMRVMVKGQPKTEEEIPLAALKESINNAAYAYTDKHLGPKKEIGNKGRSFPDRLREAMPCPRPMAYAVKARPGASP